VLGQAKHEFLVIQGFELERWMLKFMIGYVAMGWAQTAGGVPIAASEPPLCWLKTLFERQKLPGGSGLMIPKKVGIQLPDSVRGSIFANNGSPAGCAFNLMYVRLMFFVEPQVSRREPRHPALAFRWASSMERWKPDANGWHFGGNFARQVSRSKSTRV